MVDINWIPELFGVKIVEWSTWSNAQPTCYDYIIKFTDMAYHSGFQDGMLLAFFLSGVAFLIYKYGFAKRGN